MTSTDLTPQERLAISRKAIVRHMTRDSKHAADAHRDDYDGLPDERAQPQGTWAIAKHAIKSWWHYHPAHVAFDLARPVIDRFAHERPFKLLGIAAGVGAAAVVLRPWRLVSLGGLALGALKSSEMSSVVLSMLSRSHTDSQETSPTP
jgi:hypothetical protein